MMTSLAGVALPGNRKRGFTTADTEGCTCSTSSRLTKDVISISWRVPLRSQNPKFTENPAAVQRSTHLQPVDGLEPSGSLAGNNCQRAPFSDRSFPDCPAERSRSRGGRYRVCRHKPRNCPLEQPMAPEV